MSALDLGVGAILLPELLPELEQVRDLLAVVEVEPDAFWIETENPAAPYRIAPELLAIRTVFERPILAHGSRSPVGGASVAGPFVAELFGESVRRLGACMASEHLGFNEARIGDRTVVSAALLPPRQTPAGVEAAVGAIRRLGALDVPFLVETPVSYLRPRRDEMTDARYVSAVATRADCGILLDLHALFTNERNGRQRVDEYLAELPLERVWEFHVSEGLPPRGMSTEGFPGAMDPALVELASRVARMLPNLRAVIFETTRHFLAAGGVDALRQRLVSINRLVERAHGPSLTVRPVARVAPPAPSGGVPGDLEEWERGLVGLAVEPHGEGEAAPLPELASDPGVRVLRALVGAARAGRIAARLPFTTRLLLLGLPRPELDALVDRYAASTVPPAWCAAEARRFADWVRREAPSVPWLDEVLAIDLAGLERVRTESAQEVRLAVDPTALLEALLRGTVPTDLARGEYVLSLP